MATNRTLKASKLFHSWPDADIEALSNKIHVRDLSPGENLFLENDEATSLFIVVSGTVRIQKSASNLTQEVATIGVGSHLGELGMLAGSQGEKRSASAEAAETTQLIEINYKDLHAVLEHKPMLGLMFYKNLATNLAGRIRGTTEDLAGIKSRHLRHS